MRFFFFSQNLRNHIFTYTYCAHPFRKTCFCRTRPVSVLRSFGSYQLPAVDLFSITPTRTLVYVHCARECVIGLERRTDEGHAGASRSPSSVQPEGCLHQLVSNRPRFKASVCGHRSSRVFTECLIHVNRCQHRSVVRAVSLQRFASSFRVLPASGERCHRVPLIPYTAHVARIVQWAVPAAVPPCISRRAYKIEFSTVLP